MFGYPLDLNLLKTLGHTILQISRPMKVGYISKNKAPRAKIGQQQLKLQGLT
jgi:hypothetical protein